MALWLQHRYQRLLCPRGSGTTVIFVNDNLESLTRGGVKLPGEDAHAFLKDLLERRES
jgi:hypothetical protein